MLIFRTSALFFLIVGSFLVLKVAFGATAPNQMAPDEFWTKYQQYLSYKLSNIPTGDETCIDQYAKLFDENRVLKMNVFLGMMESRHFIEMNSEEREQNKNLLEISDRMVGRKMAEHLLSPCEYANYYACGFQLKQVNPYFKLEKQVQDFDGIEKKTIQVNLYSVSIGENLEDVLSRTQLARTRFVEERLNDVLNQNGVLFYSGHSRYGSGTWFANEKSGIELGFHYLFRRPSKE